MEVRLCHSCGEPGHLAHYCPNHSYIHSRAAVEWLAQQRQMSSKCVVEKLADLITGSQWLSKVRALCRLCSENTEILQLANRWRSAEGHSLLALAVRLNLRESIHCLWASGITCGIDNSKRDHYMILMKMCDAYNREGKYAWFTGKSEFAMRLEREGAMIDAEVRVSLIWNCTDDLDLHVICPSGEEIYYSHKNSQCGGTLDVDMNASSPYSQHPVENVVWASNCPAGDYQVIVNNYHHRSRQDVVPFTLEVAIQGKEPVEINSSWRLEQGTENMTCVYNFTYDPSELQHSAQEPVENEECLGDGSLPIVQNMNNFSGSRTPDGLALTVWLVLRERDSALLDMCLSLALHDPDSEFGQTIVCPQWCFLQAIWAHNLAAAEKLMATCGKSININYKYRWDVIPWDETVAQMCWRECHGCALRDRSWMHALVWLSERGADFSQVKLNFHRWRKSYAMQESQIRTFDRLVWHLSDENGWKTTSQSATSFLHQVVRRLARWGCHVPEDLDPDFQGNIEWGVNGKRPINATTYCHGALDVGLVHSAVREGKSRNVEQVLTALLTFKWVCPAMHSSTKCLILSFIYPGLGQGRLSYAALHESEGGRVGMHKNMECSKTSAPPRGYVCGRCRQAGHWRQFCPRGQ